MKSIRSFLLFRIVGGTTLVLALAGAAVYAFVSRSLEAQFDLNLSDRIQGFASLLFQSKNEISFEFSDELMPEYDRAERPDYFQLWFEDGRLVERSNSLGENDLELPAEPGFEVEHWTANLPDGREGRLAASLVEIHHVYPEQGPERPEAATVIVAVARGRESLIAAERAVLFSCVGVGLLLVTLIGVLAWIAVKKGLEPAERLATTLDAIQVEHLPESLEVGELPSELRPMADKADALIQRVDLALKRERRTAADIAHELRTPISELLTVSEVALRSGQDQSALAETKKALGVVRDVAWRMGRSVATLLKLARLEMGTESFEREGVDLSGLVRELRLSLGTLERERELRVEGQLASGVSIEANRDVLRIVLSNLLSNAFYYSPVGGFVHYRIEEDDRGWRLFVENDVVDLRAGDLASISEPFWKKDSARADRNRSGLGLALSRTLATKTGMQLSFGLEEGRFQAVLACEGQNGRHRNGNGFSGNGA